MLITMTTTLKVNGRSINLNGIVGAVDAKTIRLVTKTLGALALQNPCGGQWVRALDRLLGRTVGVEPVAALASRIWDAHGGCREFSRSTRMDGSEASFEEAWAN